MLVHHVLVGHARRHLAHPVHVVGEGDQPARPVDHLGQGMADHQGPRHFLEGAEMGKARRAVAGLEDDAASRRAVGIALQQLARLLVGPGLGDFRRFAKLGCDRHCCPFVPPGPCRADGGLFALSLAARNPWRHLDRPCRRPGRGGRARPGDRAGGRNADDHAERASDRQPARLSRSERPRPARAVRLRPSRPLRRADAQGHRRRPRPGDARR